MHAVNEATVMSTSLLNDNTDVFFAEQHHFAVTCSILSNKEKNIFKNVNNRDEVLRNVGELILATDLARHACIIEDYNNCITSGFDFKNRYGINNYVAKITIFILIPY